MAKVAKDSHPHKFSPDAVEQLLSAERAQRLDPGLVVDLLPLEPYHTVADIGCGPGFFTIPLALSLTEGKLYAFDVQPEMVKACRQLVRRAKAANVEVLQSQENSLPLPDGSLDGAFLSFTLHEAFDRPAFLREVSRALKVGGWLTLVEWNKEPMKEGPPLKERLSALDCLDLAEPLGDRKSTRLNSSHRLTSRMPSSA
jgi:ubiquinone/menaquinone biosynthesis C-methylase UbiE